MGGDKESARNAGIPVNRMTVLLFVLTSTSAAFVGMCHAILFNSAQVSGGMNDIFNIMVSVVVGGVLLTGGFGTRFGVFVGTLTFAVVNKGIDFTAIDHNCANLIIGVMLLIAVAMNESFRAYSLRASVGKKGATPEPTPETGGTRAAHRERSKASWIGRDLHHTPSDARNGRRRSLCRSYSGRHRR